MSAFVPGAVLLILLAAVFIAWPLRRGGAAPAEDTRRTGNLAAWRAAREELDRQRALAQLDAGEYERACVELDRRLLSEVDGSAARPNFREGGQRTVVATLVAAPVAALLMYLVIGAAGEVRLNEALARLGGITDQGARSVELVALLPELEAAARRRDPDGNYRYLLARNYLELGRHAEAAAYFAQVAVLYPEDAGLLAQQAQALYLAAGRQLTPAVQALVDRALVIDPAQVTLLGMVGMDRFQAGDYAGAVAAWEKLLGQLPADAPDAGVIRDGIAMARSRLGGEPVAASGGGATAVSGSEAGATQGDPARPAASEPPAADAPSLRVSVRVGEGLGLPPDATVFVFARAVNGPPMPLAVARFAVAELPREVGLDDTMSMAPGMSLSRFPEVTVVARVSQSGTVSAEPGDLEGSSGPVRLRPGMQAVDLVIDRTL